MVSLINVESIELEAEVVLLSMIDLQKELGFKWVADDRYGDVIYKGDNAGINVHDLKSALVRLESVVNSILFYSGNQLVSAEAHKVSWDSLKYSAYTFLGGRKAFSQSVRLYGQFVLVDFMKVFDLTKSSYGGVKRPFGNSYRILKALFDSAEGVAEIQEREGLKDVIGFIVSDVEQVEEKYSENADLMNVCFNIRMLLIDIQKYRNFE